MSIILGRRHRLLHVRALLATRNRGEQEICPIHYGSPLDSQLLQIERATGHRYGKKPGDHEYYIANSLKKKCKNKLVLLGYPRSNAIILQGVLPPNCIVRAERLKGGEPLYRRQYLSPRPPPKISLRHDHNWTRGNDQLGSTVEQQLVGKLVQQSFGEAAHVSLSKPTQSKPNPICDRSGKPEDTERVFVEKGKTSRSQEINEKGLHE